MGTYIKQIDLYIEKAADFAKPILNHIRELIHEACPEVEEKIKWSFPHFDYRNEMMCSMASFKHHAAMGFWKASLMKDKALLEMAQTEKAMGHLGKIKSLKDLPADKKLICWITEAMELNEYGIALPAQKKSPEKKELIIPEYFLKALNKNKKALQTFEQFSYSNKKEYLTWIIGAKTETTRNSRLSTALEWLAEGKVKDWKYKK